MSGLMSIRPHDLKPTGFIHAEVDGAKYVKAATIIQKAWRKYAEKMLPLALFEKSKKYMDVNFDVTKLSRAPAGKTQVYLPKDLPIVLKLSGSPQNKQRFEQMQQAREILKKNHYQHLVIPKARINGEWIIESRLSIAEHELKKVIGFYKENTAFFTEAVKEFTGFLCQGEFTDFVSYSNSVMEMGFRFAGVGRYDNVTLLSIENGIGKIGLIDLEHFTPGTQSINYFESCLSAICLFPYHFQEIVEEVSKYCPSLMSDGENKERLEKCRDDALGRFRDFYEVHLAFIQEKQITMDNPLKMVEISDDRRLVITDKILSRVREEHQKERGPLQNCLGASSEDTLKLLQDNCSKILDSVLDFLSQSIKEKIVLEGNVSSDRELLDYRTLFVRCDGQSLDGMNRGIYDILCPIIAATDKNSSIKKNKDFSEQLKQMLIPVKMADVIVDCIFQQLLEGREIAYYHPGSGIGGHERRIIEF